MWIVRVLVALGPLVHLVSSTIKHVDFKKAFEEGLLHADHLLFDSPARSKLRCLELCVLTDLCVRFAYVGKRGTPGTCRGYSTQPFSSEEGTSAPGAKTYIWAGLRVVSGDLSNVALNKVATQSSNMRSSSGASLAVDGNQDPYYSRSFTCSETYWGNSWWQVDLGDGISCYGYDVISVIITNRADCCHERLRDFDIHVHNENPATNPSASGALCHHYDGPMGAGVTEELVCGLGPIRGRFARVTNTPGEVLHLCEVQVMAVPAV